MQPRETLAMETYAKRSYNYFDRLVDPSGQPYFNVFWTEPAQAVHDWPDFCDVTSRQLQGAIMARLMTGEECAVEKVWMKNCLAWLGADGRALHPKTHYSRDGGDFGDQALTLYALCTAYAADPLEEYRSRVAAMVDKMARWYNQEPGEPPMREDFPGFCIKSLMACGRTMGYQPAIDLAGQISRQVMEGAFAPNNHFKHGGHMHGTLRAAYGVADYALYTGDPIAYSRVDAVYRYVRDEVATQFGFIPETIGHTDDIVQCETCALLDYLALGVTLANHGHPEYWDGIERLVRNHLVESQLTDGSWLHSDDAPDTAQITTRDIGQRVVGSYAGWSSPTQILASKETLIWWGGPEIRGKVRALQNCCGGSGTHAYYIAWKNASRVHDGVLSVNLHLDKLLPEAEIRCFQPYEGLTTLRMRQSCQVRVRIPGFVPEGAFTVTRDGEPLAFRAFGNYALLGEQPAGCLIEARYPMPAHETTETIGNPAGRKYTYKAVWRGDTVVRINLLGDEPTTGYSQGEGRMVETFYGENGPGRLYQREHMLGSGPVALSPLHEDTSPVDHWFFL